MTNQPGLKMFLDKLKLMVMGPPLNNQHSKHPDGNSVLHDSNLVLEIGNELLITDDIVKAYRGLSNVLGRVVIIDQIPANQGRTIKASAFGIQVNVDINEARHMREAYVSRELREQAEAAV